MARSNRHGATGLSPGSRDQRIAEIEALSKALSTDPAGGNRVFVESAFVVHFDTPRVWRIVDRIRSGLGMDGRCPLPRPDAEDLRVSRMKEILEHIYPDTPGKTRRERRRQILASLGMGPAFIRQTDLMLTAAFGFPVGIREIPGGILDDAEVLAWFFTVQSKADIAHELIRIAENRASSRTGPATGRPTFACENSDTSLLRFSCPLPLPPKSRLKTLIASALQEHGGELEPKAQSFGVLRTSATAALVWYAGCRNRDALQIWDGWKFDSWYFERRKRETGTAEVVLSEVLERLARKRLVYARLLRKSLTDLLGDVR